MIRSGQKLEIKRVFDAPRARVFRAFTDPNELKKWWRPAAGWVAEVVDVDLRVGGRFALRAEGENGALQVVEGEILEVVPPSRLVCTLRVPESGPEENLVTLDFDAKDDKTKLTITHEQLTRHTAESSAAKWDVVLWRLEHTLARPKAGSGH